MSWEFLLTMFFLKGQRKCKNTGRGKVKHYDVWDAQGILTKQGDTL